jgi:type I restriction enzyme S subunit
LPIIRIKNVGTEGAGFVYWADSFKDRFIIKRGDLLLTLSGSFRIAEWTGVDGLLNQRIVKLIPSKNLNHRFLLHYMQTQLDKIERMGKHALVNNVSVTDIKNFQIPLPPLSEQKRIAKILDATDALRAKRRESIAQLDALIQSVFLDMFGDPVTNPMGWEVIPLESLIEEDRPITYGILKPGPDIEDGIPYVRVVDIQNEQVLTNQLRRTTEEIANQYKRSRLKTGDLLMSIRGHVGRVAITPFDACGANITQDTARLALAGAEATYVMQCISTQGMQHYMARRTKGAAVRGINLGEVKKLPIPSPPIDLQHRYAAIVGSAEQQKTRQRAHLAELDTLFASLQHRAFNGEL